MIVGCGDLTILLVGLGFHCFLLKCKEKLRHSLGRPSRSDFVQHEFDDTLPKIYERVLGRKFDDPEWIHDENFGQEEWEILKSVCQQMYPDEELSFEMMYTLIDLEIKAAGINQRKEILESINSTIEKTFYRNEDDATQFYSDMMVRKKAHGGKYNEKFLDYQPLETEFEDGEDE